jgi:two-component system chemotaxis response regulator CheY
MIRRTLEMSGVDVLSVLEAGDGVDALAVIDGNQLDLALVDVNMPRMNGEELLFEIRNRPLVSTLPVVIVSTEASETRISRLRDLNAEFIHKPYDPTELSETIRRALGEDDV